MGQQRDIQMAGAIGRAGRPDAPTTVERAAALGWSRCAPSIGCSWLVPAPSASTQTSCSTRRARASRRPRICSARRSRARLDAVISGPLFSRYSKNPDVAFTNEDRARGARGAGVPCRDLAAARRIVDGRLAVAPCPNASRGRWRARPHAFFRRTDRTPTLDEGCPNL